MNLLYDALPDTVTVDGKAYRIYTDYRDWLRFYDMQEDDALSKREKLLLMLRAEDGEAYIVPADQNREPVYLNATLERLLPRVQFVYDI